MRRVQSLMYTDLPKVLSTPHYICEVLGSSLGSVTGCPEFFRGIPQTLQTNAMIVSKIKPRPLPSKFFPIHHLLFILSFDAKFRFN
jgi:hypothetical protein